MQPVHRLALAVLLMLLALPVQAAVKMRPYSGIGVLQLSTIGVTDQIPLYDDPGIARCCKLDINSITSLNGWLFGSEHEPFLLVTAHKGNWLEVELDDAGRTGWVRPERRWSYLPWDQFLKGRLVQFLRNSPKKQMQVVAHPGANDGTALTTRQPMKVIVAQGDWVYVLLNQNSAGWIRWRDSDGRLLVGFSSVPAK